MDILIDNKNLKTHYGIDCLDYTGALSFAKERENEREWQDKSGVDKNLVNIRYDVKEFVLSCLVKSTNEVTAYNLVKALVDDMYTAGCFVVSLRDTVRGIRECFICERSGTLVGDINVREQNGLYTFKIGLKDINPNAVKYKTTVALLSATVLYTKGQTAVIYWGDGTKGEVSNSGNYTKNDYVANGLVDIIIDIDSNAEVVPPLVADFTADVTTEGVKQQIVNFTDTSLGEVEIWAWEFGDGGTSSEQSPTHTYTEAGVYSVTLQIFNSARGFNTITKTNYIIVRNSRMLINDTGDVALINDSLDMGLIN